MKTFYSPHNLISSFVLKLQQPVASDLFKQYKNICENHFCQTNQNFIYKGRMYNVGKLVRKYIPLAENIHLAMDTYLVGNNNYQEDSKLLAQYIASLAINSNCEQELRDMLPEDFAYRIIAIDRVNEEPIYTKQQLIVIDKIKTLINYYDATSLIY